MSDLSSDSIGVLQSGQRQRLMMAHLRATKFFRDTLLRARTDWAYQHLKDRGAEAALTSESAWKVGYAPDSESELIDHLRVWGFDFETLVRAGLATIGESGQPVDRFRDRLMLLARDEQLEPVGFVAIGRGAQPDFTTTPTTLIHRPSNALVGVAEQVDLFAGGAIAVVVDDPVDAMAIEKVSRMSGEQWGGVPLCGGVMSTVQARTLYRYTATDTVVVALNGPRTWQLAAVASLADLSHFFRRVRAVELPDGHTPASLVQIEGGPQQLHDALMATRPLADYKSRRVELPSVEEDPGPSMSGPSL